MTKITLSAASFWAIRGQVNKMRQGVCDQVASEVADYVARRVELFCDYGDWVEPDAYVTIQNEVEFTPMGWHEINHFCITINCSDGFVIVDVPMKEYAYHDTKWWYWKGMQTVDLHVCQTRNELMDAWQIDKEDAMRIIEQLRPTTKDMYQYRGTKTQLIAALQPEGSKS